MAEARIPRLAHPPASLFPSTTSAVEPHLPCAQRTLRILHRRRPLRGAHCVAAAEAIGYAQPRARRHRQKRLQAAPPGPVRL